MRVVRSLCVFGVVVVPNLALAQDAQPFRNSWFWGVKGGQAYVKTAVASTTAPTVGAEWLITRTKFGLYVGLDQAYFDAVSTVDDAPSRGVTRRVDIRDLRRFQLAAYLMPRVWPGGIRPYAGVGYAFNYIVNASSQGNQYASPEARDTVEARIQAAKTRSTIIGTVGLQLQWHRVAPFVQASVMPTRGYPQAFLLNGDRFTYYLEGGLRYNFGSSIERMR
jgi:hypothetical protein